MVALVFYYVNALEKTSYIKQGEINLSKTNFEDVGSIALNGEWEFYWGQLLEPTDFIHNKQRNLHYAYVPGNWLQDTEGNAYTKKGYATYRIVIKNIPKIKYFGLKKANIRSSSKIFVNGELLLTDGHVSKSLDGSVAGNNSEVVYFELEDETAEIIIQAANHEYLVGGIAKSIIFGEQKKIMQEHQQKITFEFAMILIVFIVGLFYSFLFLVSKDYRKKESITLPLALSCLFMGVMTGIYSERILTIIFPEITLYLTFRFGHFMSVLSVIMAFLIVNKVNDVFLSKRTLTFIVSFYSVFLVLVLILPLEVYTAILNFYMTVTLVIFSIIWLRIFILFFQDKESLSNKKGHGTLIVSVFSILLFWFDMILYSSGLKADMFLSFLTISIYSIALATLLILRYTISYKENEELSIKLIETFSTLAQTTKAVQRNELAFLQAQIKPHFLFNALSSIISLCYTDGERAGKLLTDLSNYLKRSFDLDLKNDLVTIENELKLIEAFVEIEKARFGERVQVTYDIDSEVVAIPIIPLVIEPLVENAIRHGVLKNKHGGEVKLMIKSLEQGIYISVEDNGKGMDSTQIKRIQNGESDMDSAQGNGVSLSNVFTRLRSVYGIELLFETNSNGTKVYFTIPVQEGIGEKNDD